MTGRLAYAGLFMWLTASLCLANETYRQGADYARQVEAQGPQAISTFNPDAVLPGYTATPPQTGHYGGVTSSAAPLSEPGNTALKNHLAGQAITDAVIHNPRVPVSVDAPFIAHGREVQKNASGITDGSFAGCQKQRVSRSEFTRHFCGRDTADISECSRTASIESEEKWLPVDREESGQGKMSFSYQLKHTGLIKKASLVVNNISLYGSATLVLLGQRKQIDLRTKNGQAVMELDVNQHMQAGSIINASLEYKKSQRSCISPGAKNTHVRCTTSYYTAELKSGDATLTLVNHYPVRHTVPVIAWNEYCPFNKAGSTKISSECTEAAAHRTASVNNQPLTAYSACWAYKDSYQTPVQENGACGQYAENPACTRVAAQCDYRDGGVCLHENVTYSCESTVQGEGMLCGGQLFCQDGSCAQSAAGQDTLFAKAVSQLAAVAAAGKDVAATSDAQVMAFTGRAQSCKKQAVGFNNCCKDAGWGNDIGLAHCSSEEKALGQAKARRLTVDVGEYCSKKVLGICVEKKRSYCLFDSKLAQIVQQQGRQWQLGIGFGEPKSPDCRGISVSQLQALDFSRMDFSPFYADLNSNKAVPDNAPLLQRAQQQIQTQLNQKAAP